MPLSRLPGRAGRRGGRRGARRPHAGACSPVRPGSVPWRAGASRSHCPIRADAVIAVVVVALDGPRPDLLEVRPVLVSRGTLARCGPGPTPLASSRRRRRCSRRRDGDGDGHGAAAIDGESRAELSAALNDRATLVQALESARHPLRPTRADGDHVGRGARRRRAHRLLGTFSWVRPDRRTRPGALFETARRVLRDELGVSSDVTVDMPYRPTCGKRAAIARPIDPGLGSRTSTAVRRQSRECSPSRGSRPSPLPRTRRRAAGLLHHDPARSSWPRRTAASSGPSPGWDGSHGSVTGRHGARPPRQGSARCCCGLPRPPGGVRHADPRRDRHRGPTRRAVAFSRATMGAPERAAPLRQEAGTRSSRSPLGPLPPISPAVGGRVRGIRADVDVVDPRRIASSAGSYPSSVSTTMTEQAQIERAGAGLLEPLGEGEREAHVPRPPQRFVAHAARKRSSRVPAATVHVDKEEAAGQDAWPRPVPLTPR